MQIVNWITPQQNSLRRRLLAIVSGREAVTDSSALTVSRDRPRTLAANSRGYQVTCLAGTAWITQEDDAVDHILRAGETFSTKAPGRVVVQGLPECTIRT